MDSKKQERVESTIQKELGRIIETDTDIDPDILVTITAVAYLPAKRVARVFVSIFPDKEQTNTLNLLNDSAKSFIPKLQKRIRMGYIPALLFVYDPGIANNARVQQLIAKNQKPG